MTQKELLIQLHQYTPWEELHYKNRYKKSNIPDPILQQVSNAFQTTGLHLSAFPDASTDTYSEDFFFKYMSNQDILVVQHDKYTPPVLHRHDFFELLYVYEGEFTQQIETNSFIMHTGDFCLIPPQIYHSLDVCNYSIVLNILIRKSTIQDIFFNTLHGNNILSNFFLRNTYSRNVNDYIIFHTSGDLKIQGIILDMCLETVNRECYNTHLLHTNLLMLFGLLLRNYESTCELPTLKKKKDSLDFCLLKYMEEHYRTLTLQDLADRFHYSPQYISHRLKQLTGIPFTECLLKKRMQEASNLLVNTNIKVKNISENIGYNNTEHFTRLFRRYYGISPTAYRNVHQKLITSDIFP